MEIGRIFNYKVELYKSIFKNNFRGVSGLNNYRT